MLPVANLHIKGLYDSTVEFFSQRSPSISSAIRRLIADDPESDTTSLTGPSSVTDHPSTSPPNSRNPSYLRESFDTRAQTRCPSSCLCHSCNVFSSASTSHSMRKNSRENVPPKNDLPRSQTDVAKLEERCRGLERALRETKELLRTREAEVERLKSERDKSGWDRRRSSDQQHLVDPDPPDTASKRRSQSSSRQSHDSNRSDKPQASSASAGNRSSNGSQYMQTTVQSGSMADSLSSDSEEERTNMRGLDTFLTKIDRWSGAQIIQALQDLNSEILQYAASATELCTFDKYSRSSPSRTTQATKETAARLGPSLTRILSSRDHTQDPILVQLALQGCVSTCIARALSTFCLGFAAKPNAVLSQIYSQMYLSEVQSTSSRWRALTHRHIQEMHPRLEEFAVNDLVETIFRWSSDIFIISGCSNPQKASCSLEGLRARFGTQVRRIATAVYNIAKITREEIMSSNFDVIAVDHGQGFDKAEMVDAFEDYGTSVGAVLCTTDLGLSCSVRKSSDAPGREEQEGYVERRLLLRPKVVLESVADMLDPR